VMEKKKPPLKIIAPGKVYRCDSDVSHTAMFHQVEGLMVDTGVTFSDLKVFSNCSYTAFSQGDACEVQTQLFPLYRTERRGGYRMYLLFRKGCRVCKTTGWLEVLGCGMVNPRVFEMSGYQPDEYTGFAFGMGVERMTMLKYSIDDIRLFYENDLRFLKQF